MKKIFRNNKMVGVIREDTFYKKVKGSKHMLRNPRGWAVDASVFEEEFEYVEIYDEEEGSTWNVSKKYFVENGFKINRGHGDQIVLPIERWHKDDEAQNLFTGQDV